MIRLVRAEESHVKDISKLWLEFMDFHQKYDPLCVPADDSEAGFEREMVRRLMESEKGLALVALDGDIPVGYSLAEIQEPPRGLKRDELGYIHHIAVTGDYRRKGIGEKLYLKILEWFRSRGINRIELDLTARNEVAVSFWKKHGFTDYTHRLCREI
ncbi:MAG: GNAT family N-acetyltransferase [Dehalococcoidia bacterium]|jgi:ribosomal protein S18 acetylase RimI-like enzyme